MLQSGVPLGAKKRSSIISRQGKQRKRGSLQNMLRPHALSPEYLGETRQREETTTGSGSWEREIGQSLNAFRRRRYGDVTAWAPDSPRRASSGEGENCDRESVWKETRVRDCDGDGRKRGKTIGHIPGQQSRKRSQYLLDSQESGPENRASFSKGGVPDHEALRRTVR